MNNLQFDDSASATGPGESSLLYSSFQKSDKRPGMINFLMKKGIVGSEKSANATLLIVSAIFFLSAISLVYYFFYYTPSAPAGARANLPPQIQIMQKTQEYIKQGISGEEARQRATQEVMNATPNSSESTSIK